MKNTRKKMLLSSIAMLLVALIALGSATYAWFTINKTVKADGINVAAAVAKGLVITKNNGGTDGKAWSRSVTYSGAATELQPISIDYTIDSAAPTTGIYPKDVSKDGDYATTGGTSNGTNTAANFASTSIVADPTSSAQAGDAISANTYTKKYRMGIKSSDGTTSVGNVNATISCVDPDTTDNIDGTSFAKAVLVNSSGDVICSYGDAYKPITDTNPPTVKATNVTATATATPAATAVSSAQYFTLIVWYEGNDADCANTQQGAEADFTVTFTIAD